MSIQLNFEPVQPMLARHAEPQLCYVLVRLSVKAAGSRMRAVNWALVADASRSMRIPIVNEQQFRQLVREGDAQEVLIDGIPVWQLAHPVPADLHEVAPSALDYTARALHSIVEQLDHADRFSLVACAEEAEILIGNTSGRDRTRLVQGIGLLKHTHLGEETDLAQGVQLGLQELARGRNGVDAHAERLLLLTDGFTRHPERCLELARQAAGAGVAISTIGLGGEFQEDLLTGLADISGGRAVFLGDAEAIPRAIAQELAMARSVMLRSVSLTMALSRGVTLRRLTQIHPTLRMLEVLPSAHTPSTWMVHVGDLEQMTPVVLLLELIAPPMPAAATATQQSGGNQPAMPRMRLAQLTLHSRDMPATTHDLVVGYAAAPPALPPVVLDAAARANAAWLQRRALEAVNNGDKAGAVALLQAVAARLADLGESALAATALAEAAALQQTGQTTRLGVKELTYATRRLGQG